MGAKSSPRKKGDLLFAHLMMVGSTMRVLMSYSPPHTTSSPFAPFFAFSNNFAIFSIRASGLGPPMRLIEPSLLASGTKLSIHLAQSFAKASTRDA